MVWVGGHRAPKASSCSFLPVCAELMLGEASRSLLPQAQPLLTSRHPPPKPPFLKGPSHPAPTRQPAAAPPLLLGT